MMKSKADEEDYWNSSKYNAFTFDDADDELSAVRPEPEPESKRARTGSGSVYGTKTETKLLKVQILRFYGKPSVYLMVSTNSCEV